MAGPVGEGAGSWGEAEIDVGALVGLANAAAADDAAAAAALAAIEDRWELDHAAWLEDQRGRGWPDEPF